MSEIQYFLLLWSSHPFTDQFWDEEDTIGEQIVKSVEKGKIKSCHWNIVNNHDSLVYFGSPFWEIGYINNR